MQRQHQGVEVEAGKQAGGAGTRCVGGPISGGGEGVGGEAPGRRCDARGHDARGHVVQRRRVGGE